MTKPPCYKYTFMCIAFLFIAQLSPAQGIFGRVLNNTVDKSVDKLANKLEDDLSDKLAEKIAERAYRPIDKAFEDAWQSSFPKDTTTGEVDWDAVSNSYGEMLASFDKSADVPESYTLDIMLEAEHVDYSGEKSMTKMWFAKESGIFIIEDQENSDQTILFDADKDIIIMYNNTDNSAQAIPSMIKMSAVMAQHNMKQVEAEMDEWEVSKTGKTKKIANYVSEEYKGESDDEKAKFYLAKDFPINWQDAFGSFVQQFSPTMYQEEFEMWEGMIMKSENELKAEKKKSSYEVKNVREEQITIDNSKYTFKSLMDQ